LLKRSAARGDPVTQPFRSVGPDGQQGACLRAGRTSRDAALHALRRTPGAPPRPLRAAARPPACRTRLSQRVRNDVGRARA
jgi:hypothetical protein